MKRLNPHRRNDSFGLVLLAEVVLPASVHSTHEINGSLREVELSRSKTVFCLGVSIDRGGWHVPQSHPSP
jgi:hypothetical protein